MKPITDDEGFVTAYLNRLQLREINNADEFLDYLYQRHEKTLIDEFLDILDARDEGNGENLFDFKNQSLDLSLDIAHYTTDLYRQYFNWFIANFRSGPKRILDIGCENGIAACFYASLFPEAEVIGMDISRNAVLCARELAAKLNLHNVKFRYADARNMSEFNHGCRFDLITTLCTIQESVGYFSRINDESSGECSYADIGTQQSSLLTSFMGSIHGLLNSDNSRFICCERFLSSEQILVFAHIARHERMSIDWIQSGNIQFHELDIVQQIPVFVVSKKGSNKWHES